MSLVYLKITPCKIDATFQENMEVHKIPEPHLLQASYCLLPWSSWSALIPPCLNLNFCPSHTVHCGWDQHLWQEFSSDHSDVLSNGQADWKWQLRFQWQAYQESWEKGAGSSQSQGNSLQHIPSQGGKSKGCPFLHSFISQPQLFKTVQPPDKRSCILQNSPTLKSLDSFIAKLPRALYY